MTKRSLSCFARVKRIPRIHLDVDYGNSDSFILTVFPLGITGGKKEKKEKEKIRDSVFFLLQATVAEVKSEKRVSITG